MTEQATQSNGIQDREDLRDEWYGFDRALIQGPPKIYWLGMVLSAFWVLGYLVIYPSVPLTTLNTHWKGLGMPGSCQPWTAICEMQKAEDVLNDVRGNYLKRIREGSVAELSTDQDVKEFISRAGKVRFEDNCAGCHRKKGAGIAKAPDIAPALNDNIWLHGGDVQAIKLSIQDKAVHSFGIADRLDGTATKVLAIYVYALGQH